MKTKTSELLGPALNWAVAKADGYDEEWLTRQLKNPNPYTRSIPKFSTDWDEGGPIIEREWINLTPWPNESNEDTRWQAVQFDSPEVTESFGPTPLIAAMRCYVASTLGDTVEIPDGL